MPAEARVVRTARVELRQAWRLQRELARARRENRIGDVIWLLEHDPVYTTGRHGRREDLWLDDEELARRGGDFVRLDRGGQMTWHGPGQTTAYVIASLRTLDLSVRDFVAALVHSAADAATARGVARAEADLESMGVYVEGRKLASVGIRVAGGISLHGLALNRDPDMTWLAMMAPCGAPDVPSTSIAAEGGGPTRSAVDSALAQALAERLGLTLRPGRLDRLTAAGLSGVEQGLPGGNDIGEQNGVVGVGPGSEKPAA